MPKAYRIKDWNQRAENAETRKYAELVWFRTKVKPHGEGIGHTLAQPDRQGPFLYGMFKIIEQIAAGCQPRGWLIRNGTAMDAARMAAFQHLPAVFFEEALKFFSTAPMDWIEHTDTPPTGRLSGDSPTDTPPTGRLSGDLQHPTDRPTTKNKLTSKEREENGGFASKGEARQAQTTQFAALSDRKRDLEAVPEDERTDEQAEELKKTARQIKAIQKKQRAGDFTPVEEGK